MTSPLESMMLPKCIVFGRADFRGFFELDINTMSAMSIALSPLILMSEMAPPAGVARAHIVSLFIIYIIYMYMYL